MTHFAERMDTDVARGVTASIGSTRVSQNGYHYTKTDDAWRLTHHIIAEEKLGRLLRPGERVYFKDGDKENLHVDNIVIAGGEKENLERRIRHIDDQIKGLLAKKVDLEAQLAKLEN